MDVFSSDWLNVTKGHLDHRQVCTVESAPTTERGVQLSLTAGYRVRIPLTLPPTLHNIWPAIVSYKHLISMKMTEAGV